MRDDETTQPGDETTQPGDETTQPGDETTHSDQWTAGVSMDSDLYPVAAASLLLRWISSQPGVPMNVLLAAGFVCGASLAHRNTPRG